MALPNLYQTTSGPAYATYDWKDLSTGTAYKTFYPIIQTIYDSGISGTNTYAMVENSNITPQTTSYTWLFSGSGTEINFDITFTRPGYVKGTSFLNLKYSKYASGSTKNFYWTLYVYHVDGGTSAETQLATWTQYATSGTTLTYNNDYLTAEISGQKFKVGDKLRLSVKVTEVTATDAHTINLYTDPSGVSITDALSNTITRDTALYIPFKIDL